MAPTFYGVLGVGPDADREAIERGYRERVTEVHPDVNDDPDADAQFKRLTTARDTLLDADERSRYDRLGHASYVRHHVSCSAWDETVSGGNGRERKCGTESSDRERRERDQRGSRNRDWNTGRRRDTSGSSRATSGGRKQRRDEYGTAWASGTTASTGQSGEAAGSSDGHSTDWSSTTDGRRGRSNGGAVSGGADATYASSSFWESQRVGERFGTRERTSDPLAVRVLRAVQTLGIWAFIHVAFLAAAVGTSWYVYAVVLDPSTTSLPLLVVLVVEVVLAALLSSIHVATRVYR